MPVIQLPTALVLAGTTAAIAFGGPSTGALGLAGQTPEVLTGRASATAALTLTGQAPSLGQTSTITVGGVTFTGLAPSLSYTGTGDTGIPVGALTVSGTRTAVAFGGPSVGQLSLTGQAVNLGISGSTAKIPAAGSLTFTGQSVSLSLSGGNITRSPSAGALAWAGSYTEVDFKGPDEGALTLTGQSVTLSVSNTPVMLPARAALALTGQAVTVTIPYRNPSDVALTLAGTTPVLTYAIIPSIGALELAGGAVNLQRSGAPLDVPLVALTLSGQSVGIVIEGARLYNPAFGTLTVAGVTPTLSFTVPAATPVIELVGRLTDTIDLKGRVSRRIRLRGQA